jgi:DNA adenine methylase
VFKCQSYEKTISEGRDNDFIYCDPPYIDRHVDYYNGWDEAREKLLYNALANTKSQFILSTWHHNDYRKNKYIESLWREFYILTREHFYHVGGREKNRNPMIEAIVTNYDTSIYEYQEQESQEPLTSFVSGEPCTIGLCGNN